MNRPRVEILSTGTELMRGSSADGNFAALARRLADLELDLRYHSTYGDDLEDLTTGIKLALARARVVILTGGLGPTTDDLTREAAAEVFHVPLEFRPAPWRRMRERATRLGRRLTALARRQAFAPAGSRWLPNPFGWAPGFWITRGDRHFIALPGVPGEMEALLDRHVHPRLSRLFGPRSEPAPVTLRLYGVSEAAIQLALGSRPEVGYTVGGGSVHVRAPLRAAASVRRALARAFGPALYSDRDEPLEEVAARALLASRKRLAVAESVTGGLVAHRLTNVPGISAALVEAVVAYDDRSKRLRLGVGEGLLKRHGAVSRQAALAMARGAACTAGADLGLSTTGIAGPAGGSRAKPVGLVYVAVHSRAGSEARELRLAGPRGEIKERASEAALDLLRRALGA